MTTQTHQDKFSGIEDLVEEMYAELEKFVHYLAARNTGMAVEYDDIVGELLLELVKGVKAYSSLPKEQLKAVLRKMMDNRISELRYRHHVTHRKYADYDISLSICVTARQAEQLFPTMADASASSEAIPVEELIAGGDNPEEIYASKERVSHVRSRLSPTSKAVFDSLIRGNNMLAMLVWLSAKRSTMVFGNRTVKIRPWHIADALGLDEKEVRQSLKEIKRVYRGYND